MDKTASIIIALSIAVSIGIVFLGASKINNNEVVENSDIRDGIQYVTVNARGGYSPRVSQAVAGIPTRLIVKTNGTYDCSASLVIRSVGFQKILAPTGEEVIDLSTPKEGQVLQGVCGMGMYSFQIKFS